jgi:SPP1 family predicted phage head-tail adaptor
MTADRIGALRHRVRLHRPERTAVAGGTAIIAWKSVGSMFARIEPASGREVVLGDGVAARVTHRVLIRHRDGVAAEMRFVEGRRTLEIRAVLDLDGRGRWLECLCEERLP